MSTFQIPDGPKIAYEDFGGDGTPIFFSHGLFMSRKMFAPQVEHFRKNHRVIIWDERGHGETEWQGDFTYWDSANDLLALADHLGIEKFFHFGFSQGGLLGLRAAMLQPDRFLGLIQCSTQAGGLAGEAADAFRAKIDYWLDNGPDTEALNFLTWLILAEGADHEYWQSYWSSMTNQQIKDATSALYSSEDIYERLGEVQAPLIVVHGLADVSTPLDLGIRVAAEAPTSRGARLIKDGPHVINLTHPELVNRTADELISEVEGALTR